MASAPPECRNGLGGSPSPPRVPQYIAPHKIRAVFDPSLPYHRRFMTQSSARNSYPETVREAANHYEASAASKMFRSNRFTFRPFNRGPAVGADFTQSSIHVRGGRERPTGSSSLAATVGLPAAVAAQDFLPT